MLFYDYLYFGANLRQNSRFKEKARGLNATFINSLRTAGGRKEEGTDIGWNVLCSFIHSFIQYLLNTYYVLGIILGARDRAESQDVY